MAVGAFYLYDHNRSYVDEEGDLLNSRLGDIDWSDSEQIARVTEGWETYTEDQSGSKGIKNRTILKKKEFKSAPIQ